MHRDFKVDNCLMHDDKVVIADFGLSRSGRDITQTPAGTGIYMAPEVLENCINTQMP